MIRQTVFSVGALILLLPAICSSQGETAVPFLLISPYAEANGMGEASVALPSHDPLAPVTNPAQLGMQSLTRYFSAGTNYSDWLIGLHPVTGLNDLWYRTSAVNAGINLKTLSNIEPEIGIGMGYSRIYLNYGDFNVTSPTGHEVIGTFHDYEYADQYSIGAGVDYGAKLSFGLTYKHIFSNLADSPAATGNAYDYGILLEIPIINILERAGIETWGFWSPLEPVFDFDIGLAKNNLGDKSFVYSDQRQSDPLPRYARAGVTIRLGFDIEPKNMVSFRPVMFHWTRESDDVLVNRSGAPTFSWSYKSGFGGIKPFDELILGNGNPETIKKKGWQLCFFEIYTLRGGRFEEDVNRGNRNFETHGYGIQTAGLMKMLQASGLSTDSGTLFGFLLNHIDLVYNHSIIKTYDPGHPLSDTQFDSFVLCLSN